MDEVAKREEADLEILATSQRSVITCQVRVAAELNQHSTDARFGVVPPPKRQAVERDSMFLATATHVFHYLHADIEVWLLAPFYSQ